MTLHLADTFADSLTRLTAQEQKAVKTTVMDLQLNPSQPGLSFHKLTHAIDKKFWSLRVSDDIRVIVHRSGDSLLICHAGHHDAAYKWAERRRIERHPTTGAMQLVEVHERVEELPVARAPQQAREVPKPGLFDNLRKFELMSFGVPEDWVDEVRRATEDTLFEVIAHLPQEAQEALLRLAVGETPVPPAPMPETADPLSHPDAQRRFRLIATTEELEQALNAPWEKWAVFLHPSQREAVERDYSGAARVSGSAGTGKTIVAVHRAVALARRNRDAKVLLTTFSRTLAHALAGKLKRLTDAEPGLAGRIAVAPLSQVGQDLYTALFGQPNIAPSGTVQTLLRAAQDAGLGKGFSQRFLAAEWEEVVDAWQITTWAGYAGVARLGRKTRLSAKQRETLWPVFEFVRRGLAERKMVTRAEVFGLLTPHIGSGSKARAIYDFAVVDEAQDLSVAEARFLAALTGGRPNGLFLAGDLGQRIFQQPFSLKALGIDVRGRSSTLKVNYRTSHEIRAQSDRLLANAIADVDGNVESRKGTISAFNGPPPAIGLFADEAAEQAAVAAWIKQRLAEGCSQHEIALLVRSPAELKRARGATKLAGTLFVELGDKLTIEDGNVAIGTMHLAKGLEFRAVAVMACDEDVLPLQERVETVTDESELENVYDTERHLLYVACTRARDHLMISAVTPGSEFLADLS